MPGLIGFSRSAFSDFKIDNILQQMQTTIAHRNFYCQDPLFIDESIGATRTHLNILQRSAQPQTKDGYYIWLDGELYDRDRLPFQDAETSDSELLLRAYQKEGNFNFLKAIDGTFAAVLYDTHQQKLHLISDRLGMRRLYWTVYQNSLVWTSELKALLALPGYQPKIDRAAVEDFLGLRYIIGDRTWFEGVELLPAATVVTWDLQEKSLSRQRYWWWDEITPMAGNLDEREIVEELGRIFIEAVEKRDRPGERVGITLSGGLDSRALLAAMPNDSTAIEAVTYGQKNCDDLKIAERVARLKNANFHPIEIDGENWLESRVQTVWESDGSCSIVHMQFLSALRAISEGNLFEINLHGAWGDGVNGSHFFDTDAFDYFVRRRLGLERFARSDAHRDSVLERFNRYFDKIGSSAHILSIDNRMRSFTFKDARIGLINGLESRMPFIDNQLQEFLYALPDSLVKEANLYQKMLLDRFPQFYHNIPWQTTGEPIGKPGLTQQFNKLSKKAISKLDRGFKKVGISLNLTNRGKTIDPNKAFADPASWMRQEPTRTIFEKILNNPNALYLEYLDRAQVLQDWHDHLNGRDLADRLGLTLTLELWLQQVFEKRYRTDIDEARP
ncbi:MAG: asparagine synthase-related protein [Cyanobacteriota bacterium]|nr:asparagine synthase-related protein [Cyanobacteriota bacterium]